MATDLTSAYLRIELGFEQSNGNTYFPQSLKTARNVNRAFTTGTGAKQMNRLSVQEYVILASQTLTVDLQAGTYAVSGGGASGNVVDLNGAQITFARVKELFAELVIGSGLSNSVTVNGAASNVVVAWTAPIVSDGTVNVAAATENVSAAGWAVTASTADLLVVVNNQASVANVILGIGGCAT
jgi:hypothetical protein